VGDIARAVIGLVGSGSTVNVGARPGEKFHETLVTAEEAARSRYLGDTIVIGAEKAESGIWDGYTSDSAPRLKIDGVRSMIEPYVMGGR
jgi:FlaA1/EpsC-like NDP-sugar epimerase